MQTASIGPFSSASADAIPHTPKQGSPAVFTVGGTHTGGARACVRTGTVCNTEDIAAAAATSMELPEITVRELQKHV